MWYYAFIACVLLLWIFSAASDRNALRIVLIASLFSEALVGFITSHIPGGWKLAVPGAVEVLTIMALLQWAPGRTGLIQAACLTVAWIAHLFCYVDVALRTNLVYSRYEAIIQFVAVAQIVSCHETIVGCATAVRDFLYFASCSGRNRLRSASVGVDLSRDDGPKEVCGDRRNA